MDSYFSLLNLSFVENDHISIFTTFAKQSMINRLSNPINRNRSAAKISKVMSSSRGVLFRTLRNNSHGRDEKERLKDGVGLLIEIFSVTKKSGALRREQRAGLLLGEELEGRRGVSDGQE